MAVGIAALAVSACTPTASWELGTVVPSDESEARIIAKPSGDRKVDPGRRIRVTAEDGQLSEVMVLGPSGPVPGRLSPDGTVWTAQRALLDFGATYVVQATAVDGRGVPTTRETEFRTFSPRAFVSGSVQPGEGATVGVGMPITVTFDQPVRDRAAVERAMVVRTPTPLEGAWAWTSDTSVQFRPRDYWPGRIDVTVELNLTGVEIDKRVYGKKDTATTFRIGPSMVTTVNAQTHQATVVRNGSVIRTMPITTGKPGFETRSGIKVVVSKERVRIMDAATGGTPESDPEYYRLPVEYAMRVTYSGEFVHAAPWSVGSQGWANVSHGCIGMSTANAAWLYGLTNVGDVVEVTGTSAVQNLGNGITVWNERWRDWLVDSATGPVMTVAAAQADEQPDAQADVPPDEGESVAQAAYGLPQ